MATIKGQNIRLFLDGACIAASKNSQLHIAAQVENVTSKDDKDYWERNEISQVTWDASVDALVVDSAVSTTEIMCAGNTEMQVEIDGETFGIIGGGESAFEMPKNTFSLEASMSGPGIGIGNIFSVLFMNDDLSDGVLAASGDEQGFPQALIEPNNDYDYVVFAISGTQQDDERDIISVEAEIGTSNAKTLANLEHLAKNKTLLECLFSQARGFSNREEAGRRNSNYQGTGYISDVQVNAQNGQRSTYNIKITGVGELEII